MGRLSKVNNFRPEVDSIQPTGVKVRVNFGDSMSHRSRDMRLPHFVTNDDDDDRRFALKLDAYKHLV